MEYLIELLDGNHLVKNADTGKILASCQSADAARFVCDALNKMPKAADKVLNIPVRKER